MAWWRRNSAPWGCDELDQRRTGLSSDLFPQGCSLHHVRLLWSAGIVLVLTAWGAGGATLSVGTAAQWVLVDFPALNAFVRLTNQTVAFVNERVPGAPLPSLPELRGGMGLRLSEGWGGTWRLGMEMALATTPSRVQGAWTREDQTHPVEVSLEVSLVALGLNLGVEVIPDLLGVTLSMGWGLTRVGYRCDFPRTLPTDWSLPFLPRNEDRLYTGSSPVGAVAVHLFLPLGRGASVGLELGFRVTPPGIPRAGGVVLDLNADGLGDPVGFAGPWGGVAVRMEFNLGGGVR